MRTSQKTITTYTTSDNKEFTDVTKATSHEALLENEVAVDSYVDTRDDLSERGKTKLKNSIVRYLGFIALLADEVAEAAKVEAVVEDIKSA